MQSNPQNLKSNIRQALLDERLQAAVKKATDHSLAKRAEVVAELPHWEALREEAARRRDHVLAHLDQYLLELEEKAQAKGIQVHWVADAEEANRIIAEICTRAASGSGATPTMERVVVGAQHASPLPNGTHPLVVKSKSMTTEEIGLTPYLENQGFEVVETDLGEYIVQIAGQMPSHITAPALHLSRQEVGKIFAEKLGVEYQEDPVELIAIARRILREKFMKADVGITGVNFAVAETGTPLMVENEGNGRLVSAIPRVQISVMGIEKVVATWEDLMILLELLPRSATGQRITGSVIFFNDRLPDADGPREMHLVILDNGRSKALADPELRSILRCIRCGACLNVCPVYRHTGGHAYGWVYPGPIGAVLAPIFLNLEKAADHPFASTLCGACSEICPVKIELHHHLLTLRDRIGQSKGTFNKERLLMTSFEGLMDRPDLFRLLAGMPRFLLHDLLGGKWKPNLPIWNDGRETPEMAPKSFSELFRRDFGSGGEAEK
jgi:L-lactate dehydrogenase complex protein LldF